MNLAERVANLRESGQGVSGARIVASTTSSDSASAEYTTPDQGAMRRVAAATRERLAQIPDRSSMSDDRLRVAVEGQIAAVMALPEFVPLGDADPGLRNAVLDELLGFGPIQMLLDDPTVSEIMVNGHEAVWVEAHGVIRRTNRNFESEDELIRVIDRMVRSSGRRVDQSSPMVDARLPDGSRLNVILPPLAVDGPSVTIRKFLSSGLTTDDLVRLGTLSTDSARFLEKAVDHRLNILVSGGTGTGKTTILNILSSFIGRDERVVTVEDAVELSLHLPNLVRLETRPANSEGVGAVNIRDLVRNALRMRPNRIVVGEVRGSETIDMLQAMNTGHEGSLSTVHANSPRDALRRLETMVLLGGVELPLRAIREQIASSIDLVVHLARDAQGRRYVQTITEVSGMEGEVVSTAELFTRAFTEDLVSTDLPPLVGTAVASQRIGNRIRKVATT
jgi:pilus assembly protein CpaF